MPLTKNDIQNINAFLKEGSVEAARRILLNSDDDRAAVMLARIDAKYPPKAASPAAIVMPKSTTKPVTVDPLDAVKGLIAQKKYDDAEALLWTMDTPEAEELLRKLKRVQESGGTSAAVPVKAKNATSGGKSHRLRNLLLFTTVCIVIGLGVWIKALTDQSNVQGHELHLKFRVQDICDKVFADDYITTLSTDDYVHGCNVATTHMLEDYHATVVRCDAAWPDEDYGMRKCLVDGGAQFEELWFLAGAHGD